MRDLSVYRCVRAFSELTDDDLDQGLALFTEREVPEGEVLFRQGDPGDTAFVLLRGAVRISRRDHGQDIELARLGPGDYFGEMSLFDGSARSAEATALAPSLLLTIDADRGAVLLERFPQMRVELLLRATKQLRATNERHAGVSHEKEQLRASIELERLRSLSQMVAGVAHEINTPLGIIRSASSFISEHLTRTAIPSLARDDDARELLGDIADACQLIQNSVGQASRLVQSFKGLSVRQAALVRERVDLVEVINDVLAVYRFKGQTARLSVSLACDLDPEQRQWDGYPGHLNQILLNLLSNTERYAYAEGEPGKVEVSLSAAEVRPGEPGFELVVRDFGRGISEADQKQIFEPFFTTGRDRQGTGLGLSIVYNLVTSGFGGSVRVRSKPGEGAAFILKFPRVAPEGAAYLWRW